MPTKEESCDNYAMACPDDIASLANAERSEEESGSEDSIGVESVPALPMLMMLSSKLLAGTHQRGRERERERVGVM